MEIFTGFGWIKLDRQHSAMNLVASCARIYWAVLMPLKPHPASRALQ
jgi:hypothetical protein